ncbi:MAG TPA: hypothetical protein VM616_00660 [Gammaproteobacteria bacterium]|nr:hypothetical protein [Gammaproteobacteria bacterium]
MKTMRIITGRSLRATITAFAASLAACATVPEPEDINEARYEPAPIEVSSSRLGKVSFRPGREIPQTLSPMTVYTSRDLQESGYSDIASALRSLSPF